MCAQNTVHSPRDNTSERFSSGTHLVSAWCFGSSEDAVFATFATTVTAQAAEQNELRESGLVPYLVFLWSG